MATSDRLSSGGALATGGALVSSSDKYIFTNQYDGNLVIYRKGSTTATWSSGTQGKGSGDVVMERDGNVVFYNGDKPLWSTFSQGAGTPPYKLVMQDDGNLVVYDTNSKPTWASQTSSSGLVTIVNGRNEMDSVTWLQPEEKLVSTSKKYSFVNQLDGNLCVYEDGKATWASGSYGKGRGNVFMQNDGNLVFYDTKGTGKPVWASQTGGVGKGPFKLVMQDDGNLVIYDSTGKPTWATNTGK